MLDAGSQFWQRLSAEHTDVLDKYGFGAIKRRQALRYFNWQWRWSRIHQSEQMGFLLRNTSWRQWLSCASTPPITSARAWEPLPWSAADRWLYTFAVRLLWEYAAGKDAAGALRLPEPLEGAPPPVYWRGRLISQDLANTALEVEAITRARSAAGLSADGPRRVIEVGAGYGRTAYVLLSLFPSLEYTVVDIEPALSISRWYLTQLFPERHVAFLSPSQASSAGDHDLAISISSLHEMTPQQVESYLSLIDGLSSGGLVYLKQWRDWHNPVDQVRMGLERYPIPRRWARIVWEPCPVQTSFVQGAWFVSSGR